VLSSEQRRLPRIYLEHDPPRLSPTDTCHPVDDSDILVVHVTHFNDLMWDCGRSPTTVVEHGVMVPDDVRYSGELERGIVVVNDIARRGRRLGADIFARVREEVPLDLVGMGSTDLGGLGEIKGRALFETEARYRFFFNPIRYTSLGLSVCEAMMLGLPVVGLATTEMTTVVTSGVSGYLDTNLGRLIEAMRELLRQPDEARLLGDGARAVALERFNIGRFVDDWNRTFSLVAGRSEGSSLRLP
jgi:glycosyltransferase involved in cell wall biosynthesis